MSVSHPALAVIVVLIFALQWMHPALFMFGIFITVLSLFSAVMTYTETDPRAYQSLTSWKIITALTMILQVIVLFGWLTGTIITAYTCPYHPSTCWRIVGSWDR